MRLCFFGRLELTQQEGVTRIPHPGIKTEPDAQVTGKTITSLTYLGTLPDIQKEWWLIELDGEDSSFLVHLGTR